MKVKICGVGRYEDASAALDAGAWALGFVFHRPSRRYIEPKDAARIARRLPRDVLTVGVFVDAPLAELNAVVKQAGLRAAQLHGNEDPEYVKGVSAAMVIKAFRVGPDFDLERARSFPGHSLLLDAYSPDEAGGTGKSFDWSLARRLGKLRPIILAGGITPLNVEEAIEAAMPEAIDVSSGVESAPGRKDKEKIAALFRAIERYEARQRKPTNL
jgi:phosphoribosylanthranilate isomerase